MKAVSAINKLSEEKKPHECFLNPTPKHTNDDDSSNHDENNPGQESSRSRLTATEEDLLPSIPGLVSSVRKSKKLFYMHTLPPFYSRLKKKHTNVTK